MKKRSYAKINLGLDVKEKKSNGYHELDMLNISINLYDTVSIKFNETNEIKITADVPEGYGNVPLDKSNSVYKVLSNLKEINKLTFGANVHIKKKIPVGSGLGGGSSNAAVAIHMANKALKLNMSQDQMIKFSLKISADIPYCLYGATARVKGIGETVKPIDAKLRGKIVLVVPAKLNSTKEVFSKVDLKNITHPNINKINEAILEHNFSLLAKNVGNSLLKPACELNPEIADIMNELKSMGFEIVSMSGTGSAIFAYSDNNELFKNITPAFKAKHLLVKIVKAK